MIDESQGFGLAPLKGEGVRIPFDEAAGPELTRWQYFCERLAFRWARLKAKARWWLQ